MADYSDTCADDRDAKNNYLVLDIGGGTVDITALKCDLSDGTYRTIIPPEGSDSGGMKVNEEFSKFLQNLVEDNEFSRLISNNQDEHRAAVTSIINNCFEKIKKDFGDTESEEESPDCFRLMLDRRFVQFYTQRFIQQRVQRHSNRQVQINGETLELSYALMKSFFQPVLEKIKHCVMHALVDIEKEHLFAVYIAGGFGGCRYIHNYLRKAITTNYKQMERVPFLVPDSYMVAVSQGAVHYCRQPDIITSRTMDATYGLNIGVRFKQGKHEEEKSFFVDEEEPVKYCKDVFQPFVFQGEKVKLDEVFTANLIPLSQAHKTVAFRFYCSTNPNLRYVTDKDTHYLGEISLETQNPEDLPNSERCLDVTMSFSSTEITAYAQAMYLPNQPYVKTVLDFLTK